MSKRRAIGDIVLMDDDEGRGPYRGRIVLPLDGRASDPCPGHMCNDRDCQEWRIVEVLDSAGQPTGERVHHVPECHMADAN